MARWGAHPHSPPFHGGEDHSDLQRGSCLGGVTQAADPSLPLVAQDDDSRQAEPDSSGFALSAGWFSTRRWRWCETKPPPDQSGGYPAAPHEWGFGIRPHRRAPPFSRRVLRALSLGYSPCNQTSPIHRRCFVAGRLIARRWGCAGIAGGLGTSQARVL